MRKVHAGAPLAAALLLIGCDVTPTLPGPEERHTKSVEAKGAEMVTAEIHLDAGKLDLTGGAGSLLDSDVLTNRPDGAPVITYDISSFRGRLKVSQKPTRSNFGHIKNEWNLKFSDSVPLDFKIHMGAGQNQLDLRTLALRSVEVHMGAGQLRLDLRGDYKRNINVSVHGGVGQATVLLPAKLGARAEVHGGIGNISARGGLSKRGRDYVNEAYKKSPITVDVQVHGGVGEVILDSL